MNWPQVYMYPPDSETPFHLPPRPIPLCCPRAPDFWYPAHAPNLHWPSILHIYFSAIISNHPTLTFSH